MIRSIFITASSVVILGLILLISILPTPAPDSKLVKQPDKNSFFIQNITLFDGTQFLEAQDLEIQQGLIVNIGQNLEIPENIELIEGQSLTLIPGLIDAHTHSYMSALNDALRFGVTTHLDMFTTEQGLIESITQRESLKSGNKADLFSSGTMATVENGHGTQYGFPIDTIDNIEEVASWVDARKQAGADYIKLVYMPYQNRIPSLGRTTAKAVIIEAKKQGMMAVAHISNQAAAKDMIEDGIDGLVHIFADKQVEDSLISLAKEKGVFIIPTLSVIASVNGKGNHFDLQNMDSVADLLSAQQKSTLNGKFGHNIPGFDLDIAQQNVKRFFDAGVPILAGSDAPNPGTAYGISTHGELQLLVAAGLSEEQALRAATSIPAQLFSLEGRGKVTQGARADFVLLNTSPATNIKHTLDIHAIFKNGFKVSRVLPSAKSADTLALANLGDFEGPIENALGSQSGMTWSHSDDAVVNGNSVVKIQMVSRGDNNSALQVSGEVRAGFSYPWAGAAVGDFTPPMLGIDASRYTKVIFDVKGKQGSYRIMAFDTVNQGIPPYQMFQIGQQWQTIEIELAQFSGLETQSLSGLSFVAGPTLGEFHFTLDNVRFE